MSLRIIFFFSLLQFTRQGEGTWFFPDNKNNQINTKALVKYLFVERTS